MTRKRVAVVASVLIAVLVLTVCLCYSRATSQALGDVWRTRQDLAEGRHFAQELAAAKAQGLPTQMADLQRPVPPLERNAAPVYVRLTALLEAHRLSAAEEEAMTLRPGRSPSSAQWARIAQLMHDRADVMALVHQAASRPECVFARDWTQPDPLDIKFPELGTVSETARLLEMESLLMAHQGKPMLAVRNQALGFQVARHGTRDGTLIAYLDGLRENAMTLDGLKRIMTMAGPNAALDDSVGVLIAKGWKPPSLSHAVQTDLAFSLGELAALRKKGSQGLDAAHRRFSIPLNNWDALLDYNGLFLLREYKKAAQVADGPYAPANPVLSAAEAQCGDQRHPARFLAGILAPMVGSVAGHRAQAQALADVTRTGASVLALTARKGHPPDSLPFAVTDPYDGKPLGYRREGTTGFVIYSAGADGRFDGGKPGEYTWKPYQVAFRYPGPLRVAVPLGMLK